MGRAKAIAEAPLTLARWLLLAAIVLAAWLFGATRPWTVLVMTWWLLSTALVFTIGLLARRRWPRVRWFIALPSLFLLAQGWFMTWNARCFWSEPAQVFTDVEQPLPGWPGVVDCSLVFPWMLRTTALLTALWIASDMSANRVWRDRLWATIGATGVSIMALGLAQRFSGATSIFWDTYRYTGEWFFAVYRYHANAGAYINLVLPMITGLAICSFLRSGSEKSRVFWTLGALTTAACGFVNVSRAANVITACLAICICLWIVSLRLHAASSRRLLNGALLGALAVGVMVFLAVSFDIKGAQARWEKTKLEALLNDGRPEVYEIMVNGTLPEAGLWGFGQGTFEPVFNTARRALQHPLVGRWDPAHSDALQTIQDWGYAGSAAWAWLLLAGLAVATSGSLRRGSPADESRVLSSAGALALAGVMLHACVDFPLQILSLQLNTLVILGLVAGLPPRFATKRETEAGHGSRPEGG